MSSEISTDKTQGLQPWQFFVLAGLGCATAVTFIARGRDVVSIILLSVLMGAAALAAWAVLRTLRPLVSPVDDRTVVIGERTRAALEREKMLALRSIKELEFDRAMGKLSDDDWKEMSTRLRARAGRLIRQLDAGAGYRGQIERDLAKRLEKVPGPKDPAYSRSVDARGAGPVDPPNVDPVDAPDSALMCASCATANDTDARFCKACGHALAAR
jgi:hypothetical protein